MPIIGPDPKCLEAEIRRKPESFPSVLVSAITLVDIDGRVLISKRPDGKTMAGLWEFPGGKVENTETPEEALIREIREELGLDINDAEIIRTNSTGLVIYNPKNLAERVKAMKNKNISREQKIAMWKKEMAEREQK